MKKAYITPDVNVRWLAGDVLMGDTSIPVDENPDNVITDSDEIEANSFSVWDEPALTHADTNTTMKTRRQLLITMMVMAFEGFAQTVTTSSAADVTVQQGGAAGMDIVIDDGDDDTPYTRLQQRILARQQLTDVPTVYFNTSGAIDITDTQTDRVGTIVVVDGNGNLSEFSQRGAKLRGYNEAEWGQDGKRSFLLTLNQPQNMVCMGNATPAAQWVLHAMAGDKSMMRYALTCCLSEATGLYSASHYRFCDLVVNDCLLGTYLIGDQVDEGQTMAEPPAADQLNQASLVNWYLASEIMGSHEAFSLVYGYTSTLTSQVHLAPLPLDVLAYDNYAGQDMSAGGLMADISGDTFQASTMKTAKTSVWRDAVTGWTREPWFVSAVKQRWQELADGGLHDRLALFLTSMASTLAQTQRLNYKAVDDGGAGWDIGDNGLYGITRDGYYQFTNYSGAVEQLTTYLDERFAYLSVKIPAMQAALLAGDVNGDGLIDINDVMALVSYICGQTPGVFVVDAADVNADGEIDINDVMRLVDMIVTGRLD